MEDEMYRHEVYIVEWSFMQRFVLVISMLKSVYMGGDECASRHRSLIQTFLMQLQSLDWRIRVLGHRHSRASSFGSALLYLACMGAMVPVELLMLST